MFIVYLLVEFTLDKIIWIFRTSREFNIV